MLHVGESLVILPINGLPYTVKSGDTIDSIAKKFSADATEILSYNGIEGDLAPGSDILIPDGELAAPPPSSKPSSPKACHKKSCIGPEPAHNVGPIGTLAQIGYYVAPLADYIETQGIHGYNAVDLAAPVGTPIFASASGEVIVAKQGGWNGGYGSYVVIQHDNGSQTLYGHMSKVVAYDGQSVVQGQVIGYVGATGKATGPHVHFEIRNGIKNPF
jgi:murein DD-endopeptidase MepM/ murein hydrolase activator NlpD